MFAFVRGRKPARSRSLRSRACRSLDRSQREAPPPSRSRPAGSRGRGRSSPPPASCRRACSSRGSRRRSSRRSRSTAQRPTSTTAPPRVEVAAPAQHFAEKLHALTRDHGDRLNTRVRDLVDLMLLIELELVRAAEVLPVVRHVFESGGTHPVPGDLQDPPAGWARDYAAEAVATSLRARALDDAMARLRSFWHDARGLGISGRRSSPAGPEDASLVFPRGQVANPSHSGLAGAVRRIARRLAAEATVPAAVVDNDQWSECTRPKICTERR